MGLKYQVVACQFTMRVQILLLVATVTALLFAVPGSGEADLQALSLEYGYDLVEGEVPITLVESGLDNGTMFRFLILDDYSEAPENWSQPWFNDSNWSLGAAPFGDREYNNVNPNTIWDTSGESPFENDALLIRHSFDLPAGTIVSAEIDVAFANYCTPFLNGNLIYSERGGNSHGMEYWNDDGTESLAPELFNSTDNVLAVYARDYVYGSGGQNRQWIDLQITGGIDAPLNTTTGPVTMGDQLTLVLNVGNGGNSSAELVTVKLQADGETVWQQFLPSFAANTNATILVDWTPQRLGDILLNLSISSESNESNYLNNSFETLLHIHHWEYMLEYSGGVPLVNSSGTASFNVTVRNTGDLADVLTFTTSEKPQGWGIDFHPEWMELAPGESRELLLNVSVPEGEINGDWNFSIEASTQNSGLVSFPLVQSGRDDATSWRWTTNDELYDNNTWTLLAYNDSAWSNGTAPFGDSSVSGVNYNTEWNGNNYAYFRHVFNISNLSAYSGGVLTLSIATNGAGTHYLNGVQRYSDLGGGDHGAEYWNAQTLANLNTLVEGENILASVVRNQQNQQWYDEQLEIEIQRANLWNFHPQPLKLELYLDTQAPLSRAHTASWSNDSSFPVSWEVLDDSTDIAGFELWWSEHNGSGWSDWTLDDFYTGSSTTFNGEDGYSYRFRTLSRDVVGNVEQSSLHAAITVDMTPPQPWLAAESEGVTSDYGSYLGWGANSSDVALYQLQLWEGSDWVDYYSSAASSNYNHWFPTEQEGILRLRLLATDFAGNTAVTPELELEFDRSPPQVTLATLPQFHGAQLIELQLTGDMDDLTSLEIEYARLPENEMAELEWKPLGVGWVNGSATVSGLDDGWRYWFRLLPEDAAGNRFEKDPALWELLADGSVNLALELPVLPMLPVYAGSPNTVIVQVKTGPDTSTVLQEYNGLDYPAGMGNMQFMVDYENGRLLFGNGVAGYRPAANASLIVEFEAYDGSTVIDLSPPLPAEAVRVVLSNANAIELTWETPADAVHFAVERSGNLSEGWQVLSQMSPVHDGLNSFTDSDLSGQIWYYRVVTVDRMGYRTQTMEVSGVLLEYLILDLTPAVINEPQTEDETLVLPGWLPVALLALLALAMMGGGAYLVTQRQEQEPAMEVVPEPQLAVPLDPEPAEAEEPDEPLETPPFGVVGGTQYSRHLRFRCDTGCEREFPGQRDDDEIICPHCGTIGTPPEIP